MAKSVNLINSVNSSFEIKCLTVLVKSYETSISEKKYSKDWEEKTFSSHLVSLMKKCELAIKYDLTVTKEEELEDYEIDNGLKSPKEANPIDIRFHNIWMNLRLDYNVEAKNISVSEWGKSSGSKVNASQQQTEYITKGIDRFLTGHFKYKNGCMLGYIVNGKLEDVLTKINTKIVLQKNSTEIINLNFSTLNSHKIFESIHSDKVLKHLFLDFVN
jgi:hypothetical protein